MRDLLAFVAVAGAFALWLTAYLGILAGLAFRAPAWRALVALVLPPLSMYWAIRERMHVRAVLWAVGAVGYGVARVVAGR